MRKAGKDKLLILNIMKNRLFQKILLLLSKLVLSGFVLAQYGCKLPGICNPSQPGNSCNFMNVLINEMLHNPFQAAPSNLAYTGSPYILTEGVAINTITPTISGAVSTCTSSPDLPAGLVIDNSSCAISGVPLTGQAASNYTITAANASGSASAVINITILRLVLYVGGSSENSTPVGIAGYWRNDVWTAVPSLDPAQYSDVSSIVVSGTDVYVGGYSGNAGGLMAPGYWKNGVWVGLSQIDNTKSSEVWSLFLDGSDVYAAGYNRDNTGVAIPGYWKNGVWNPLPATINISDSMVYSIVVSGSDVYAGGFNADALGYNEPGYWKNGTWIGLSRLSTTNNSEIYTLMLDGADVYAAGYNSNGKDLPGYWKNGVWTPMPVVTGNNNGYVNSMVKSGSDIYAAGNIANAFPATLIIPGYWKNGVWVELPMIDQTQMFHDATSIAVNGTDVYIGGYSSNASGVYVPGYWKNGVWNALPAIDPANHSYVYSVYINLE